MTPRPETDLLIRRLLAPRGRWRERVVATGRAGEPRPRRARSAEGPDGPGVKSSPRVWTWAALIHRAFPIDALALPLCRGRRRLIATLHDPA